MARCWEADTGLLRERVRCGRNGVAHGPENECDLREPSFRSTSGTAVAQQGRARIGLYGSYDRKLWERTKDEVDPVIRV